MTAVIDRRQFFAGLTALAVAAGLLPVAAEALSVELQKRGPSFGWSYEEILEHLLRMLAESFGSPVIPNTPMYAMAEVFARSVFDTYEVFCTLIQHTDPLLAQGESLERLANLYGETHGGDSDDALRSRLIKVLTARRA